MRVSYLKYRLLDKLISVHDFEVLEKVNEIIGDVDIHQPVFKITEEQKNMLVKSEEDILNGDLITDQELNEEEDKWLNGQSGQKPQKARREILEYWIQNNQSNTFSKKLSQLFKKKIDLLKSEIYLGKPTDFKNVRVSLVNHYSLFYKVEAEVIIIVGIWDNRRNSEDLRKNLET